MMDTFVARWRSLTLAQQLIIGAVAALLVYGLVAAGDFLSPARLLAVAGVLFLALPLHELAHAMVAVALGDPTPRVQHRLTLNPLAHLDPVGAVLILLTGFGWAKPVMWNPRNIRVNVRLGSVLVAIAGPLTNLLLAVFSMAVLGWTVHSHMDASTLQNFLYWFASINVLLAVFNLIPIPPLDGSHVLFALLPASMWQYRAMISQYGMLFVFAIVFLMPNLIRVPTQAVMGYLESFFLT